MKILFNRGLPGFHRSSVVAAVPGQAVASCVGWSAALRRKLSELDVGPIRLALRAGCWTLDVERFLPLPRSAPTSDLRSAKGRIRRGEPLTSLRAVGSTEPEAGFTLIELLVVIIMIAILASLLYPAINGAQRQAKNVQAKNDLTQIVSAVNAFYTEYGKYPVNVPSGNTNDAYFGTGTTPSGATSYGNNDVLLNELRACTATTPACSSASTLNTRLIVFLSPPTVKNQSQPRAGIATQTVTVNGISIPIGSFVDPWGMPYNIEIDTTYDNSMTNPYGAASTGGAGPNPLSQGAIAWSFGSDQKLGTYGDKVYRTSGGAQSDDVISWQ